MVRPVPWHEVADAWPLLLGCLALFAIFYVKNESTPAVRLIGSAHGLLLSAAIVYSVVAGAFTWDPDLPARIRTGINLPLGLLLLGALISIAASFLVFRGSRWYLLLHIITIPLVAFVALVGGTHISHISP